MPKAKHKAKTKSLKPAAPASASIITIDPPRIIRPPSKFIVDTIFPAHELHIIGGPAHGGKTTLLYQMADDLHAGRNIFGYVSHYEPFCFISCMHSGSACRNSIAKLDAPFPWYSFVDNAFTGEEVDKKIDKIKQVCDVAMRLVPDVRIIFLDGLMRLFDGSITDNSSVGKFLSFLIRTLQERDLSMIATGRAAKPKEASNGFRSIDRFLGCTAWTELSSTFMAIEPVRNASPLDPRRTVTLMPKYAAASFHHFKFSGDGRLIEAITGDDGTTPERIDVFANVISVHEGGERISTSTLLEIGKELDIPKSTIKRYLGVMLKQGRLKDAGHGWYRIPNSPSTIQ